MKLVARLCKRSRPLTLDFGGVQQRRMRLHSRNQNAKKPPGESIIRTVLSLALSALGYAGRPSIGLSLFGSRSAGDGTRDPYSDDSW